MPATKTPPRNELTEHQADQLARLKSIIANYPPGSASNQRTGDGTGSLGLVISCVGRQIPAVWLELQALGLVAIGNHYGCPTVKPVNGR